MKNRNFSEVVKRSVQIRKLYHNLEREYHKEEWTVEEDALAFLTDAALFGRLTMSQQGRWPTNGEPESELEHKLGECTEDKACLMSFTVIPYFSSASCFNVSM